MGALKSWFKAVAGCKYVAELLSSLYVVSFSMS